MAARAIRPQRIEVKLRVRKAADSMAAKLASSPTRMAIELRPKVLMSLLAA